MLKVQKSYVAATVSTVLVCVGGLGCSGSSAPSSPTPTQTTSLTNVMVSSVAPVINSVNVTPLWGIATLHEHTFTSDASDPDDDTLTYRWNETNTGALLSEAASFKHTFDNLAGTETKEITLTVQDADGLSTSSHVAVTSISLTGTWVSDRGMPGNLGGSKLLHFYLTQSAGDTSTGHFQPRPHYKDFCCYVTGTGEWASFLYEIGPEGEPGIVQADGTVRLRAKWLNNDVDSSDGFIFQSIDGGAGSFDFTPTQGVTMKGEFNSVGVGISDYLLTFTQQ